MIKKKHCPIFLLLVLISSNLFASTWFESQHRPRRLAKAYQAIDNQFSSGDFSKLFAPSKLTCESNLVMGLLPLGVDNVKFAFIKAHALGLIDEVEADILLDYSKAIESSKTPSQKFGISNGSKSIGPLYRSVFDGSGCLEEKWQKLSDKVTAQNFSGEKEALISLNSYAFNNDLIDRDEFSLANMQRAIWVSQMNGHSTLMCATAFCAS